MTSGWRAGALALVLGVALVTMSATAAPRADSVSLAADLVEFSHGVASGATTDTSAVLWTRTAAPAVLIPELASTADFVGAVPLSAVATTAASDFTTRAVVQGLFAGTRYYYRFRGPGGELSPVGTFKTAPSVGSHTPVRFAFSGDLDWKWAPYPLLNSLNRQDLDFFVLLGDSIYETTSLDGKQVAEDLAGYRTKYRQNREPRAGSGTDSVPLRATYGRFGTYVVLDNHELGLSKTNPDAPRYSEGGAPSGDGVHTYVNQTPGFEERMQAFVEYQPVLDTRATGFGDARLDGSRRLFQSYPWGDDAILILTDDRSYRDIRIKSSDGPEGDRADRTMLGRPQLAWLESELSSAQQRGVTWKFIVVSSPMQQLGRASEVGVERDETQSWAGGYRFERDSLLKFIDESGIDNVVFLTTDYHYTAINNLRYHATPGDPQSPMLRARNAFEIITGPIGARAEDPDLKLPRDGRSFRDLDRQVVDILNGDAPNLEGVIRGLKQAGLDSIGLEVDFPGLVQSSLRGAGSRPGLTEPVQFATFYTETYAVLTIEDSMLTVQVEGFPTPGYQDLSDPSALAAFMRQQAEPILSFQLLPMPR